MALSDLPWSQSQETNFIVQDSEEENDDVELTPRKMLKGLPALRGKHMDNNNQKMSNGADCQERNGVINGVPSHPQLCKTAAGSQGEQDDPSNQAEGGDDGDGDREEGDAGGGGEEEAGSVGHGAVGGGQGGGDGGPGGGGGGDGGGNDDDDPDDDDEEEEQAEETLPSSSSSGNSMPQLLRPAETTSPRRRLPAHLIEAHGRVPTSEPEEFAADTPVGRLEEAVPVAPSHGTSESEAGGISDAPTAIVSDTEGHGQVIEQRSPQPSTSYTSPGRYRQRSSSPGQEVPEVSSAISTISSLTSSSSSEDRNSQKLMPKPSRKRPPPKKLVESVAKRARMKESSTDTSDRTTTTTSDTDTSHRDTTTTTTTSDTSGDKSHDSSVDRSRDSTRDKSHDTSGDRSGGRSGDQTTGNDNKGDVCSTSGLVFQASQQDMFTEDTAALPIRDTVEVEVDDVILLTPAEKIGSLQLSATPMLVPESPSDESPDCVPPTLDAYGSVPLIIPSSPGTESQPQHSENDEQGNEISHPPTETGNSQEEKCPIRVATNDKSGPVEDEDLPRSAQSLRPSNKTPGFQEWQPSFDNISDNGISGVHRSSSSSKSSTDQNRRTTRQTNQKSRPDMTSPAGIKSSKHLTSKEESQQPSVEIIEQQPAEQERHGAIVIGSSQDLALHFTQTQGEISPVNTDTAAEHDADSLNREKFQEARVADISMASERRAEFSKESLEDERTGKPLTLDMIGDMSQDSTQNSSMPFKLDLPTLEAADAADSETSQKTSVFRKAREARMRQLKKQSSSSSGDDPYEFTSGKDHGERLLHARQLHQLHEHQKKIQTDRKQNEENKDGSTTSTTTKSRLPSEKNKVQDENKRDSGGECQGNEMDAFRFKSTMDISDEESEVDTQDYQFTKLRESNKDTKDLHNEDRDSDVVILSDLDKSDPLPKRQKMQEDDAFEKTKSNLPSREAVSKTGDVTTDIAMVTDESERKKDNKGGSPKKTHGAKSDVVRSSLQDSSDPETSNKLHKPRHREDVYTTTETPKSRHSQSKSSVRGKLSSKRISLSKPEVAAEDDTEIVESEKQSNDQITIETRHEQLPKIFRTTNISIVSRRTITILEERVGGKTVKSTVTEEKVETLSHDIEHSEEVFSPPSPSRSVQTMTSGDLGDISSMSRSTGSKPSSSLPSPIETASASTSISLGKTSSSLSKTSSSSSLHKGSTPSQSPTSGNDQFKKPLQPPLVMAHSLREQTGVGKNTSEAHSSSEPHGKSSRERSQQGRRHSTEYRRRESAEFGGIAQHEKASESHHLETEEKTAARSSDYERVIPASTGKGPDSHSVRKVDSGSNAENAEHLIEKGQPLRRKSSSSSTTRQSESLFTARSQENLDSISDKRKDLADQVPESILKIQTTSDKIQTTDEKDNLSTELPSNSNTLTDLVPTPTSPTAVGRRKQMRLKSRKKTAKTPRKDVDETNDDPISDKPDKGRARINEDSIKPNEEMVQSLDAEEDDMADNSPTIPHIGQTPQSQQGTDQTESQSEGQLVFGKWKDKYYYPGCIRETSEKATTIVHFEDGDARRVSKSNVINCDLIPIGLSILANRGDDWSELAEVTGHYSDLSGSGHRVRFPDDTVAKVDRDNVILTPSQAVDLKQHLESKSMLSAALSVDTYQSTSAQDSLQSEIPAERQQSAVHPSHAPPHDDAQSSQDRSRVLADNAQHSTDPPQGDVKPLPTPSHDSSDHAQATEAPPDGSIDDLPASLEPSEDTVQSTPEFVSPINIHDVEDNKSHEEIKEDTAPEVPAECEIEITAAELERPQRAMGQLEDDECVLAKWKDNHFYPGHVICKEDGGRYTVTFADGDIGQCHVIDIVKCDLLPLGVSVLAHRSGDWSEMGSIVGHYKTHLAKGYVIEFPDGETSRIPKNKISLTNEQVIDLVGKPDTQVMKATMSRANVSLDNLMSGKRKRNRPVTPSSVSKKPTDQVKDEFGTPTDSKSPAYTPDVSTSKSRRDTSTKKGLKRKLSEIEPKYTSTPTPKRTQLPGSVKSTTKIQEESEAPSPFEKSLQKSLMSSRKAKVELFGDSKGPIPVPGCRIFHGMTFLMTHVKHDNPLPPHDAPQHMHDSLDISTDCSNIEDDDHTPFDKNHLSAQIEAGGGVILDEFDHVAITDAKQCYLIAETYQRTVKYFLCLAASIPCVSHAWIRDCCRQNKRQDYKSYLLPTGVDIETNNPIEWHSRGSPFRDLNVLVSTENPKFKDTWSALLKNADCRLLQKFPTKKNLSSVKLDYVLADKYISPSILQKCESLRVPVVSSEWVIQGLVTGSIPDRNKHPKYKHSYTDDPQPTIKKSRKR